MRTRVLLPLLILCLPARGEEGLRVPRSSTTSFTHGRDEAAIAWPFGSVRVAADDLARPPADAPHRGEVRAETRGIFRLSYDLAREGDAVVVRRVAVTSTSHPEFRVVPTKKLREHEAVHVAINDREARRIEAGLRGFRVRGVTPRQAEARLKEKFREEVAAVRRLHAAWDDTHVFLSTDPAAGPR